MTLRSRFLEGQLAHLIALVLLLAGLGAVSRLDGFFAGDALGLSTRTWTLLAVAVPIVHQVYVWLCWRLELHAGALSRRLGAAALPMYATGFFVLILARPITLIGLAVANAETLALDPRVANALALAIAVPGAILLVSLRLHFGFVRATGADHFDPRYRSMPLVRQGIFRLTPNAMYVFGLALLWIPGLLTRSLAATAVAAFSHAYIWVHYLCTERPDMAVIYGREDTGGWPPRS